MKDNQLQEWLNKWRLTPSEGARVLNYSKSKVSETLSNTNEKKLPPYIAAHIETFNLLAPTKARALIKLRLK
jgi:hypothetical protein